MGASVAVIPSVTRPSSTTFSTSSVPTAGVPVAKAGREFEGVAGAHEGSLATLVVPSLPLAEIEFKRFDSRPCQPLSPRQQTVRQIAAFLLGDESDLSDIPAMCEGLADLGYSISAPEWLGLYDGSLEGVPNANMARHAVVRDMWHRMYTEGGLVQRAELVRILQDLPFDAVFVEGAGIEASRELKPSPPKPVIVWKEEEPESEADLSETGACGDGQTTLKEGRLVLEKITHEQPDSTQEGQSIPKRRAAERVVCAKDQVLLAELVYLKQEEVKKLAELLVPGILSHPDPTRFFTVLGEQIPTTSSSMWKKIFFDGAGFGAYTDDVRKTTERSIVMALCARVADVGAVAPHELAKIDWDVLNANLGGDVSAHTESLADLDERWADASIGATSGIETPSKDTYFITTTANGLKIVAAATAALAARLRVARRATLKQHGIKEKLGVASDTPQALEQLEAHFYRQRQHRNVFEAIIAVGHDEHFAPYADDGFTCTDAPAGTEEKKNVLMQRVEQGYPLWHTDDRADYRLISGALVPPRSDDEWEAEREALLQRPAVNHIDQSSQSST